MEQLQTNAFLGQAKITTLLRKFSFPCILALLVSALYNIVDQIFIGNSELGYLGNAATGVVFPILFIAFAFAWCFGDGTAAYMSICQGRKDTKNAPICIGNCVTFTLIASLVLMAAGFLFMEPILRAFGASDVTLGMSVDYFTIVLAALPFNMLGNAMNSSIRADGSPSFSMIATTSGAVTNIILDPIFIFACKWGIQGAAWATIIGQIVSFVLCVIYYLRPKTFRLHIRDFLPCIRVFRNAVKLGISTFITQMSIVLLAFVCNRMLFLYGSQSVYGPDIPISVISIQAKVFTVAINIVVGIILGGQPILGYNYGAGNLKRVRETFLIVLGWSLAIGLAFTAVIEIFPDAIIGIFGSGDALYLEFARKTFRIFLMFLTFTCTIKMVSIFFQAVGQPVQSTVTSLVRDVVCFVPLVIFLPQIFGLDGVLYAAPAADVIAIIVTVILLVAFFRKLKRLEREREEKAQRVG